MPEPSLHHIGYVTTSIAGTIEGWRVTTAATAVSQVFEDQIQRARVIFLDLNPAGSPKVELVEPVGQDSPVAALAQKGGGLHHLCFEVDDLDAHITRMKKEKALLIRRPQPAVAFEGRRIAWMRTREALLVEYLER